MNDRKALIVGASGLIGSYCLQALLANPNYSEVIALVRKPLLKTHSKLNVIITNFNNLAQITSSISAHDIYCCLGTTIKKAGSQESFRKIDFSLVVTVAELMKKQGAEQLLVISSIGADENSKGFYLRVKGEMEEAVKGIDYNCLRIIRPSLLLGKREEFRFGEGVATVFTPLLKPFLFGSLKKYKPVEAELVAQFLVKIAYDQPVSGVHLYESDQIV